jgi:hypothetical protein
VIGDVITPVHHRAAKEGGKPDAIDSQRVNQIVEFVGDSREIAIPVTVAVGEAQWVDLIEDRTLPPGRAIELGVEHQIQVRERKRNLREHLPRLLGEVGV